MCIYFLVNTDTQSLQYYSIRLQVQQGVNEKLNF